MYLINQIPFFYILGSIEFFVFLEHYIFKVISLPSMIVINKDSRGQPDKIEKNLMEEREREREREN